MSSLARVVALSLACAVLMAACAYKGGSLVTNPDGTVDSTHGPNGAQTTPH
jgi:hypothetical protein